jgi:hypothetical protein
MGGVKLNDGISATEIDLYVTLLGVKLGLSRQGK